MKAFSSGYERLLRIRKQQTMLAELDAARANEEYRQLCIRMDPIEQELETLLLEINQALLSPVALQTMSTTGPLLRALNEQLRRLRPVLQAADEQRQLALTQLQQASRKQQLVDSLLARHWREFRTSQRIEEELELFELSQNHSFSEEEV